MAASQVPHPGENVPYADSWSFSKMPVKKFTYRWTVERFNFCKEILKSSTFTAGTNDEQEWCIVLYPNGDGESCKEYISLFLQLVSCNGKEVLAKYTFYIINGERVKTNGMEVRPAQLFVPNKSWGFDQFIRRDKILNDAKTLLPDGALTIFCEIEVYQDRIDISGQNNVLQYKVQECRLSDDFGKLLENQEFGDVTLSANGRQFNVYKGILAARSPVFAAMFAHDMIEGRLNRVEITDVDHEVLREMLRFIYTGKAENLEIVAGELLAAANKYAIERLKEICEKFLYTNLCIATSADTLILADVYAADKLKAHAIEFINGHATEVVKTTGWKSMQTSYPHLFTETFLAIATKCVPRGRIPDASEKNGK